MTALAVPEIYVPPGVQRPRHLWVPDYDFSYGDEAVALARVVGLDADAWQQFFITVALAMRGDKFAAFEIGLEVARQNGKGGCYELREIAGLFLLKERLLVHTAHEAKTAEQALDRMEILLQSNSEIWALVKTIKRAHGQEGVYLKSGAQLRYTTRTAASLRGWSINFLGVDEAMKVKDSMLSSVFPTMAAMPNPQIMYAGSAVDQETMPDGVVFARVRERGIAGGDPDLAYFGYSAPFDHPSKVTADDAANPENWAAGNPALGIRITEAFIAKERKGMSARGFAVERLGVGDWPETSEVGERVISDEDWDALEDPASKRTGVVRFAFDVTPDRQYGAVAVAGKRADGLGHVELVDHHAGTGWMVNRIVELHERHGAEIFCDGRGPAASLIPELQERGVTVEVLDGGDQAKAFGMFIDAVADRTFRHRGQPELSAALKGAAKRPLGDAFAWSRKSSSVDISPLVACTEAFWAASTRTATGEPMAAWA